MVNILDGICPNTPILDFIGEDNCWPKSATRKSWLAITRELIKQIIADIDLDPEAISEVEEAFISAGLL